MTSTVARRLLPVILVAVAFTSACGGQNPYQSAETAATSPAHTGDNQYLPARENLSDCIGTAERPDCGSKSKGGWQMYLTFGVLVGGMSFIGWRVVRSVRARDAAVNTGP